MPQRHALIVNGGHEPDSRAASYIDAHHLLICADSGLEHALALGLTPHVVIGDMDSVHPRALEQAAALGADTVTAPADKDLTDTELAVEHALAAGADAITVWWGGGDRSDHVMGVVAACSSPGLDHLEFVHLWIGGDLLRVALPNRPVSIPAEPGRTVSLMPLAGPVEGVRTTGLRWRLDDDTLHAGRARGVSNVATDAVVTVSISSGRLGVITPHLTSGGVRS